MAKYRKHPTLTALFAMLPIWIVAIIFSVTLCECSGENPSTPRRKAFPRIVTHDSTFIPLKNSPLHFEISSITSVTLDSISNNNHWVNIFYKPYNATIHCTFSPANRYSIDKILANRAQRMALNSGDLTSELIELTNANNFHSQILITTQSKVTPIQFISTNGKNWVVSGSIYLNNNHDTNIDSILPIINVLKRDVIHSLKTINNL